MNFKELELEVQGSQNIRKFLNMYYMKAILFGSYV